ncbi:MAG: flippase activity-associated protein Agl23 [Haloarculaceae archaeon]
MSGAPRDLFADLPGLDRLDRLSRRVVAVAVVALFGRLLLLGARVSHFDEGRVGWWTMHFLDTGQFEYRFIIHGPLVQHVNRAVFSVLGANDFTLRLFVAVVGAALPLAALLFRERLREDEVLGVAAFLAANPLLVYYSRFLRSSVLVAAFAFVAFGLFVRSIDLRSPWYAHAGVAFVALAFAAKENAAVYLLCWAGAAALVVDHRLFRTGDDESGLDWALARLPDEDAVAYVREGVWRFLGYVVLGALVFFAVTLFFYAPRSPDPAAVGFWQGLTNPTLFPELVSRTVDDVTTGYGYWFGGSADHGGRFDSVIDQYARYLGRSLESLAGYALPLVVLAVAGFLAERYTRPRPRMLVLFAGYWGFVSVVGYPLGTDIFGAWIMVNALVPLAIPAGIGLAMVVRWTRDALHADAVRFGISVFVLVLIVGQLSLALVGGVYTNATSDDNELVQFAQPADDFRPAMRALEDADTSDEDADVLFVGERLVRTRQTADDDTVLNPRQRGIEPLCTPISDTLPVQWYIEIEGATGTCAVTVENATAIVADQQPTVVVTEPVMQSALADELVGYRASTYRLRTSGNEAVFFVRQDR